MPFVTKKTKNGLIQKEREEKHGGSQIKVARREQRGDLHQNTFNMFWRI